MEIHINPVSLDQAGFLIDILLMAKVSVPRQMFADILSMIAQLRAPPSPSISFLRWRVDGLKLGVMHRSRVISGMGSSCDTGQRDRDLGGRDQGGVGPAAAAAA